MNFIHEKERIYINDKSGKLIAEITFPTKDGVSTIDHTFVDESLRGQGVAGKLMEEAINHILNNNNKISATCSYAVKWLEKHPAYKPYTI